MMQTLNTTTALTSPAPLLGAADFWDRIIEILLVALLAFMPGAFGVVWPASETVVLALAATMAICLSLKYVFVPQEKFRWSAAYWPLLIFGLLVVVQLLPLPAGWVAGISPATAAWKTEYLPDPAGPLRFLTLTFYPDATRQGLRLLLAVGAVFVVVFNTFQRPEQIKRLLTAVSLIGGLFALLALAQDAWPNGKIYWCVATPASHADAGPFVNHSHYAQFMNLSMGAALGLLLVRLRSPWPGRIPERSFFGDKACRRHWLALIFPAAVIVAGAASVLLSLSRGGMISMFIAAAFTAVLLARKRRVPGQTSILPLLAFAVLIFILYLGFDAVYDRLATLRHLDRHPDRGQILRDVSAVIKNFPVWGIGLNTHAVVFTLFNTAEKTSLPGHVENEYLQVLEETGLVGLACLVVFAVVVWRNYYRSLGAGRHPIALAAFGLGFALLAVMIHSLTDFGQHLPANACLSAVFCALLLRLPRLRNTLRPRPGSPTALIPTAPAAPAPRFDWARLAHRKCLPLIGLFAVSLLGSGIVLEANDARRAHRHAQLARQLYRRTHNTPASPKTLADYRRLLAHAGDAARLQPLNVYYRYELNVYRWQYLSHKNHINAKTIADARTWRPFVQNHRPQIQSIIAEFHSCRALCPTYGPIYCVVGQLERFVLDQPVGADHLRTAWSLSPCDPVACFTAGLLDVHERQWSSSLEKFQRYLTLGGTFYDVAKIYLYQLNRPDLAVVAAGQDYARLHELSLWLERSEPHRSLAPQVRAQALALLKTRCDQPDAAAGQLAALADACYQQQNFPDAIRYFQRALNLDYGQTQWRLTFAQALAHNHQFDDAVHQLRICLRLEPEMPEPKKLLGEWIAGQPPSLSESPTENRSLK